MMRGAPSTWLHPRCYTHWLLWAGLCCTPWVNLMESSCTLAKEKCSDQKEGDQGAQPPAENLTHFRPVDMRCALN